MAQGKVLALHVKLEQGGVRPVDRLTAVADKGFEGDRCFGKRSRQALLISTESLTPHGYVPGQLREQLTVDFPGLQALPIGTTVQVGPVLLEIEADCEPCTKMGRNLGEDPEAFKQKMDRNRGMLAKVKSSGQISVGDDVRVVLG